MIGWPAGTALAMTVVLVGPVATASASADVALGLQAWTRPSQAELREMSRAGVRDFRAVLTWSVVEPEKGRRDWAAFDRIVVDAARERIRVLPVLLGSPGFVARRPQDPPRDDESRRRFARFVKHAVDRYGRGGSLWRERPGVPYRPVVAWQVWNEPNLEGFWSGAPRASEYAHLLHVAARAIRSADRRARVVLAGLPGAKIPSWTYLRRLYRVPGAARLFDVVAIHPYARDHRGVLGALRRVRDVMDAARDRRTPVWITEIGWATDGGSDDPADLRASEATQARLLTRTFRALDASARRDLVQRAFWFAWRDHPPRSGEPRWWAQFTGLRRADGSAKPAWRAFRRLAASREPARVRPSRR
jgi:polysaccharide biosynthesis protein PslG